MKTEWALLVGPNGISNAASHQTVHVTLTPAHLVSNLTRLPLQLQLHGHLSGPAAMPCAAGATLPLLQMWATHPSAMPAASLQATTLPAESLSASEFSSLSSLAAHEACRVSITVDEGDCSTVRGVTALPATSISLSRPTCRKRLELTHGSCSSLLTYRVLRAHGYHHLIVFKVDTPLVHSCLLS